MLIVKIIFEVTDICDSSITLMKHNHLNFEDGFESFHTKTNEISTFISKHEQKINMSEAEWAYFLDIISLVQSMLTNLL